ncbi:hypothetical protein OCC_05981 [Thermococcus litoralis DSM 5473]|uniref:DUF8121 domain-containing protein n=1 Tax=Thermococcus litoralis (strain ATCC 51850 / DSM 5473 / JCM 8560 / NS-C) TaxID=523849 RepID=H3ZMZ2_THELN|nr:hypothetical protein [Thermococcus litoralis]EHR78682.1 hypothetical protein OCC_05981 [Thermococcus litoralis DSM 5473]
MKRILKLLALLILLFAICTLGVKAFSVENLRGEKIAETDEVHSNFYNSKGKRVATFSLMEQGYYAEDVFSFRIHVWHREGGKTKSLRLVITPNVSAEVYLKTPDGYPWNPIKLQRSKEDLNSVVLEIPDLGFQGVGSTRLDFVVIPLKRADAISITVKAEFELSEGIKRYKGETVLNTQLKKK